MKITAALRISLHSVFCLVTWILCCITYIWSAYGLGADVWQFVVIYCRASVIGALVGACLGMTWSLLMFGDVRLKYVSACAWYGAIVVSVIVGQFHIWFARQIWLGIYESLS